MEFRTKLQELRKQKGLTQEELAQLLYVSRTAVSKWESGRGYPNIDSLKSIAKVFSVSIDELLSGEELLTLAEEDQKDKVDRVQNLIFGLLDLSVLLFLFMPFFGQESGGMVQQVSLLSLQGITLWLRSFYCLVTGMITVSGVLFVVMRNCRCEFWSRHKFMQSVVFNILGALLFIITRQTYAAIYLFLLLLIKVFLLIKQQ